MLRILLATTSLILATACGPGEQTEPAGPDATPQPVSVEDMPRLSASLVGDAGDPIGEVTLVEGPLGVMLTVQVSDATLLAGWHGLHIHQVGDCSDTGEFKRSGGHLGMIADGHGLLNAAGPEKGDLPNIHIDANGAGFAQMFSPRFSFADIRDEDGAALIMHEGPDDHISQPIGGAGARVACAVLKTG